jgi:hypothetical protein
MFGILEIGNYSVKCPGSGDKSSLKAAILNGTVTWHAFPFNCEVLANLFLSAEVALSKIIILFRLGS